MQISVVGARLSVRPLYIYMYIWKYIYTNERVFDEKTNAIAAGEFPRRVTATGRRNSLETVFEHSRPDTSRARICHNAKSHILAGMMIFQNPPQLYPGECCWNGNNTNTTVNVILSKFFLFFPDNGNTLCPQTPPVFFSFVEFHSGRFVFSFRVWTNRYSTIVQRDFLFFFCIVYKFNGLKSSNFDVKLVKIASF